VFGPGTQHFNIAGSDHNARVHYVREAEQLANVSIYMSYEAELQRRKENKIKYTI
jgi:hypothetical protein